jgi:hypothetical protein
MLAGVAFGISELCVSKITLDLISTPSAELSAEVKLQLKGIQKNKE